MIMTCAILLREFDDVDDAICDTVLDVDTEINLACDYRDQLKRHCNVGKYVLEVDLRDLQSFDSSQSAQLRDQPAKFIPIVCTVILPLNTILLLHVCSYGARRNHPVSP